MAVREYWITYLRGPSAGGDNCLPRKNWDGSSLSISSMNFSSTFADSINVSATPQIAFARSTSIGFSVSLSASSVSNRWLCKSLSVFFMETPQFARQRCIEPDDAGQFRRVVVNGVVSHQLAACDQFKISRTRRERSSRSRPRHSFTAKYSKWLLCIIRVSVLVSLYPEVQVGTM
jgi:hypothetical protein